MELGLKYKNFRYKIQHLVVIYFCIFEEEIGDELPGIFT